MELVDGPSLAGVLTAGPLDPARSLDIVAQAASGLHAAHLAGLVHRDIKPANLLLAPGGMVKITDFGIARAADSARSPAPASFSGTPGYLAPERVMGAPATAASDLYSLGVVAYECLAGTPPFTGLRAGGGAGSLASARFRRCPGQVPEDVAALVLELTAKDPADRPRSAGEVARRAGQVAARRARARPPAQVPRTGTRPSPWPGRRHGTRRSLRALRPGRPGIRPRHRRSRGRPQARHRRRPSPWRRCLPSTCLPARRWCAGSTGHGTRCAGPCCPPRGRSWSSPPRSLSAARSAPGPRRTRAWFPRPRRPARSGRRLAGP